MSTDTPAPEGTDPQEAPPAPEAPAAPSPWSTWEQAGVDPSLNPYDVRKGYDVYQALQDRSRQLPFVEEVLRRNGHLPEGLDLREGLELLREYAQQQSDPWAQLSGDPGDQYGQDPGQYQEPQAAPFDPRMIQSAVQAEIQAQMRAFQEQQAEQARMNQWQNAVEDVKRSNGLDDVEAQMVSAAALQFLNQNPTLAYKDALDQAHREYTDRLMRRAAALGQQQAQAPQVSTPQGPAPAGYQPPATLEEANRQVQEMIRQGLVPGM